MEVIPPSRSFQIPPSLGNMVNLFCIIVGVAGNAFEVKIDDGASVAALKKEIKQENNIKLKGVDAGDLQLFLAKKDGAWLMSKDLLRMWNEETPEEDERDYMSERLDDPTVRIKEKFPSEYPDRSIHVLVQVPRELLYNQPKPRDSSNEWLAEFFNHKVEPRSLPFVGKLSSFVTQPLPAKIRVKQEWLNEWALSPGLQEKMFVLDDDAPCMEFTSLIFNKRTLNPFRRGKTENAFISMWDSIFRNVLDVLFTQAHIDRDSCNGSSTRQKRPDFLFVLDQVCVFRGEEKPPDVNISVPTEELCSKLVWAYGSVPYVFGYAASGYDIQLHALCPLDPLNVGGVVTKNIGTFNLEVKEHLFQIVLVMLNLSLLFQAIADECPASGRDEFRDITRSSGWPSKPLQTSAQRLEETSLGTLRARVVGHVYEFQMAKSANIREKFLDERWGQAHNNSEAG
ncbi:hypothetical protein DVH05_020214 [Phytophthora capsici]|nr:hypothetical protein DVH05_020214 [Phytophthora capsici]